MCVTPQLRRLIARSLAGIRASRTATPTLKDVRFGAVNHYRYQTHNQHRQYRERAEIKQCPMTQRPPLQPFADPRAIAGLGFQSFQAFTD